MASWRMPHLDEDAADDAERHQPARRPRAAGGRDHHGGARVGGRPLRRARRSHHHGGCSVSDLWRRAGRRATTRCGVALIWRLQGRLHRGAPPAMIMSRCLAIEPAARRLLHYITPHSIPLPRDRALGFVMTCYAIMCVRTAPPDVGAGTFVMGASRARACACVRASVSRRVPVLVIVTSCATSKTSVRSRRRATCCVCSRSRVARVTRVCVRACVCHTTCVWRHF